MPITNPTRIEVLDEGSTQGLVSRVDFTGAGVAATVSGSLATVNIAGGAGGDIAMSTLAPAVDETITANYGAYVPEYYEVADGKFLEVGAGAVFEIG